jgi:hypothetical protein
MIPLAEPITVTPPPITGGDGSISYFNPIIISGAIDYSVSYDDTRQIAMATIKGVNRQVLLWEGTGYLAAGQWTDADTDLRLSGILGADPASAIEGMFSTRFAQFPRVTPHSGSGIMTPLGRRV